MTKQGMMLYYFSYELPGEQPKNLKALLKHGESCGKNNVKGTIQ